jgi:hypothetical protein
LALEITTARWPAKDTGGHSPSHSRHKHREPALGSINISERKFPTGTRGVIAQTVDQQHLELNLTVDLSIKEAEPEVLSYSWPLPDEALNTLTGLTDHPDWLIV